jgi:alanyl-tRNA synthetase
MITFDPVFSIELCGGCHVPATGRIGFFKITAETAVAAGVRRIEAITAEAAEKYVRDLAASLQVIRQELKNPADAVKAVRELHAEIKNLRTQLEQFELERIADIKQQLLGEAQLKGDVRIVKREVPVQDAKLLKTLIYQVGQELGEKSFVLLGTREDDKAQIMLYISEALVKERKYHAGQIVKELAKSIQGGGGGQPFFASAGGTDPNGLQEAFLRAEEFISQ